MQNVDGRRALSIEQERRCEVDYAQINLIRRAGYKSLLYPDLYDHAPYIELARKYGIAPLASVPSTNIYTGNEGYGLVRYKSDRYGFRNPDVLWEATQIDVLLLGASYVQEANVDEPSTISDILNSSGLKALNLGTGSNSPIHFAALAQTFINVKKVKVAARVFHPRNVSVEHQEDSIFNEIFFKKHAAYFQDKDSQGSPASLRILSICTLSQWRFLIEMPASLTKSGMRRKENARRKRLFRESSSLTRAHLRRT